MSIWAVFGAYVGKMILMGNGSHNAPNIYSEINLLAPSEFIFEILGGLRGYQILTVVIFRVAQSVSKMWF